MSAAKDGPRDWDKELAEVDKLIEGLQGQPPKTPPARQGPGAAVVLQEQRAFVSRQENAKTWVLFSLSTLLGAALTWFWPYGRECGMPLYGFAAATGVFGIGSLWSTWQSWKTRSALVHFLSIGLIGWCAFLGAREVLPRIGYAKQDLTIRCWNRPAPAPAPPPAAAPPAAPSPAPADSAKAVP